MPSQWTARPHTGVQVISPRLRAAAMTVAFIVAAYDLLTLLVQTMPVTQPSRWNWIGVTATLSLVAAMWVGVESFGSLVVRRGVTQSRLPREALLAGRLVVASLSTLAPIGDAISDRRIRGGDWAIMVAIYGTMGALPLSVAAWAMKSLWNRRAQIGARPTV